MLRASTLRARPPTWLTAEPGDSGEKGRRRSALDLAKRGRWKSASVKGEGWDAVGVGRRQPFSRLEDSEEGSGTAFGGGKGPSNCPLRPRGPRKGAYP